MARIKAGPVSGSAVSRRPGAHTSAPLKKNADVGPEVGKDTTKTPLPPKTTAAGLAKRARKAQKRKRLVLKDIKRCQATSELLTSRAAIARVVRDILGERNSNLRLQPEAIDALCVSTEAAVAEAMARSNECAARVAGREGVLLRDFQFAVSTLPHFTPRSASRSR